MDDVLKMLENSWGIGIPQDEAVPDAEPKTPGPCLSRAKMTAQPASCEWVGLHITGNVSDDIDRDVARLIEMMKAYLIRPYLCVDGSFGISFSRDGNWENVKEFSALWFTAAGDTIISLYGDRMPMLSVEEAEERTGVIPWKKPRRAGKPRRAKAPARYAEVTVTETVEK